MSAQSDAAAASVPEDTERSHDLDAILLESLSELAAAGHVEKACRLAGKACVVLRRSNPTAARRFDVLLHRLTPKLTW